MSDPIRKTPDVLVLGGGGILGEAWMTAVLSGLDESEGFDARSARAFVGTSAGSIVAVSLAGGLPPSARLGALSEAPATSQEDPDGGSSFAQQLLATATGVGSAAVAPLASMALGSSAGGGALVRRAALRRVPSGRRSLRQLIAEVRRLGIEWDGRLRVATVELETGRRVVFGSTGAPQADVASAVAASCSIPGFFRPVPIGDRTYVDGGAWSPTNMDAAPAGKGDDVLCLNPTGAFRPTLAQPAGALGPVSRGLAATEALALRRRGARVTTINPDPSSAAVMGVNLMDPRPRQAVIEAGLAQGRRLARGLGPTG
jgi:NTE family protein